MTQPLPGTRYGTLWAWPEPNASSPAKRWRYLPGEPSPQRTPAGTPQVTMIDASGVLMLTVGASLGADSAAVSAARAAIAAEGGVEACAVEMQPADLGIRRAVLELVSPSTPSKQLAQASPSPTAPYPAAFSAVLQGDAAHEARTALMSGNGRLQVRYEVDLAATRTVTAHIEGDWERDADLDRLLSEGKLKLSVSADAGASAALIAEARAEVLRAAHASIAQMSSDSRCDAPDHDGPATRHRNGVAATVTRSESVAQPVELVADVRNWVQIEAPRTKES